MLVRTCYTNPECTTWFVGDACMYDLRAIEQVPRGMPSQVGLFTASEKPQSNGQLSGHAMPSQAVYV